MFKYAVLFIAEERRIEDLKLQARATYLWLKDQAERCPEEIIYILRHAVRIAEDAAKEKVKKRRQVQHDR